MKLSFILCLLLVVAALAGDAPYEMTPPLTGGTVPSRFLVVPGCAASSFGAGVTTTIRVDTATGRTWQLMPVPVAGAGPGENVLGWVPMDEDPFATARKVAAAIAGTRK